MTTATIDRATPDDIGAILAIDVLLVARERQGEIVRASVVAGGCVVVRDRGAIAGYLTWDRGFFGRPFVALLVVEPLQRRRGLGRALVTAAEREAARFGELFISTEQVNEPMQAMLVAMGYEPSGAIDNINAPGNRELLYYKRLCGNTAAGSVEPSGDASKYDAAGDL